MSVNTPPSTSTPVDPIPAASRHERVAAGGAETKNAFKTTEFVIYVLAVIGVLLASDLAGNSPGRLDPFLADKAWLYITVFTVGYLISRGLAKSGSREH